MSNSFAAIVGGAGGVIAILAIVIGFVHYCMLRHKNLSNRNSDTGSSDPSAVGKFHQTVKGIKLSNN